MADLPYALVKLVHVLSAALWIGAGVFNAFVLQRLLATAAPETRRDFGARLLTASIKYVNAMGGVTILSGFVLLYLHPHGMGNLTGSLWGKMVLAGMLLSFAVIYLINFAIRPTMRAIAKVTAQMPKDMPPPANLRFLMARMKITSIMNIVLMLVTFGLMIGANVVYFGP